MPRMMPSNASYYRNKINVKAIFCKTWIGFTSILQCIGISEFTRVHISTVYDGLYFYLTVYRDLRVYTCTHFHCVCCKRICKPILGLTNTNSYPNVLSKPNQTKPTKATLKPGGTLTNSYQSHLLIANPNF